MALKLFVTNDDDMEIWEEKALKTVCRITDTINKIDVQREISRCHSDKNLLKILIWLEAELEILHFAADPGVDQLTISNL